MRASSPPKHVLRFKTHDRWQLRQAKGTRYCKNVIIHNDARDKRALLTPQPGHFLHTIIIFTVRRSASVWIHIDRYCYNMPPFGSATATGIFFRIPLPHPSVLPPRPFITPYTSPSPYSSHGPAVVCIFLFLILIATGHRLALHPPSLRTRTRYADPGEKKRKRVRIGYLRFLRGDNDGGERYYNAYVHTPCTIPTTTVHYNNINLIVWKNKIK